VIYDRPTSLFVARFIGENNAIPAEIEQVDGEKCRARASNGTEFKARRSTPLQEGDQTHLCIRPESIRVLASGEGAENVVSAIIRQAIFHGDHVRFAVDVLGCHELIVKIPRRDLGAGEYSTGSNLLLGWAASDCLALDAPAGAS
jgi:putative spermidine/putrescine transport system ATP-binding protein